jgi:hypothetical protein
MSETPRVRFARAIDLYVDDQRAEGRINSPHTERAYRDTLARHAEDVRNRDPAYTNRDDVKRTQPAGRIPTPARRTGPFSSAFTTGALRRGSGPQTRRGRPNALGAASRLATASPAPKHSGCSRRFAASARRG